MKKILLSSSFVGMLILLLALPTKAQYLPDDYTVGLWHLDMGVDPFYAEDSSVNLNHGTIFGATFVEGVFGQALSFDGVDDYVNIADSDSLDVTSDITLEAWFKITSFTALPHLYIVSKDNLSQRSYGIAINQAHGNAALHYKPGFIIFAGGTYKVTWGTTTLDLDTWYHIMGGFDASTGELKLYLNGVLESSEASTMSSIHAGLADLQIGARQYPGIWRCFFNGAIDEVRISNVVRMPVEIDIKPESFPNSVNLNEKGQLPVAILTTPTFDVMQIDPESLQLGGGAVNTRGSKKAPKTAVSYEDVDGDGDIDMMVFFSVPDLVTGGLTEATTALELTGTLTDGTHISGLDFVRIVPE